MIPKIAALIITLVAGIFLGIAVLAFMLLAMNGYAEKVTTWGLGIFAVLSIAISVSMSVGAFYLTGRLIRRQFGPVISALAAVAVCTIAGTVLNVAAGLIGIGLAEFVRVNY